MMMNYMENLKEAWALQQHTLVMVFVVAPAIVSFVIGLLFYVNGDSYESESKWKAVKGWLLVTIDIYLLELAIFVIVTTWAFISPIVGVVTLALSIIGAAVYAELHYDIAIELDII